MYEDFFLKLTHEEEGNFIPDEFWTAYLSREVTFFALFFDRKKCYSYMVARDGVRP